MDGANPMSDAERARLEQRRDRLMELIRGSELDSEDREDLMREWKRLDDALNRR
jgi:hypothetical protein